MQSMYSREYLDTSICSPVPPYPISPTRVREKEGFPISKATKTGEDRRCVMSVAIAHAECYFSSNSVRQKYGT